MSDIGLNNVVTCISVPSLRLGGSLERELQPKLELPRVEHCPGQTESRVREWRDEQGFTWYRRGGKGSTARARRGRCSLLNGEADSVIVVERNDRGCAAEDR